MIAGYIAILRAELGLKNSSIRCGLSNLFSFFVRITIQISNLGTVQYLCRKLMSISVNGTVKKAQHIEMMY